MNKVNILGVKIDKVTQVRVLEKLDSFLGQQIITANPEIVLAAWQNQEYRDLINNSELVVADGIGLLWAAKFLSLPSDHLLTSLIQTMVSGASLVFAPDYCKEVLPERISGVDLMEKICELASQKNWKIYLLGAQEGIAAKTAEVLKNKYLNLNIVGAEAGGEIPSTNFQDTNNFQITISKIEETQPDILFVAMGSPKQDFMAKEILRRAPWLKLAMGVGGAFDFISGKTRRAPVIYQDIGIEWLWRLFTQPWRFFRTFNATVRFIWNVIKFKQLYIK
ncbi:MAG: WecB/TagA/CpsF family glycosyltransferase [Candidatus Komeilibacteria bacterium]|nr:WecB/TagA/CpsF family glycosyltransferase [Candidatus Komeilibacteria bacterium]